MCFLCCNYYDDEIVFFPIHFYYSSYFFFVVEINNCILISIGFDIDKKMTDIIFNKQTNKIYTRLGNKQA